MSYQYVCIENVRHDIYIDTIVGLNSVYRYIRNRAIPISELQVAPAKLVNNMSSGVPVPSLGHLFPKLE